MFSIEGLISALGWANSQEFMRLLAKCEELKSRLPVWEGQAMTPLTLMRMALDDITLDEN